MRVALLEGGNLGNHFTPESLDGRQLVQAWQAEDRVLDADAVVQLSAGNDDLIGLHHTRLGPG